MSLRENKRPRLISPHRSVGEDRAIRSETSNSIPTTSQSNRPPFWQSLGVRMPTYEASQDSKEQMIELARLFSQIQSIRQDDREMADMDRDSTKKRLDKIQEIQSDLIRRIQALESPPQNLEQSEQQKREHSLNVEIAHREDMLTVNNSEHQQHLAQGTEFLPAVVSSGQLPSAHSNPQRLDINSSGPNPPKQKQGDPSLLLPLLHKMDFRNSEDLMALKSIEDYRLSLALFSEKEKHGNEGIAYSVRSNNPFSNYLCTGDRKNPNKLDAFWLSDDWKDFPTILELHAHREHSITQPAFPKYVWEVGEIYNRRKVSRTNQWTEKSTGYHLVLDVTSPSKALWMVYRCAESSDGIRIDRDVTRVKDTQWHPFVVVTSESVDAALVFAKAKEWNDTSTPVGSFKSSARLVKETGRVLQPKPTFITPVLEEVKREIAKGWGEG